MATRTLRGAMALGAEAAHLLAALLSPSGSGAPLFSICCWSRSPPPSHGAMTVREAAGAAGAAPARRSFICKLYSTADCGSRVSAVGIARAESRRANEATPAGAASAVGKGGGGLGADATTCELVCEVCPARISWILHTGLDLYHWFTLDAYVNMPIAQDGTSDTTEAETEFTELMRRASAKDKQRGIAVFANHMD